MKPATSLCSWRDLAGTRRCTNSRPPRATRQITPITSTPYITVVIRADLPLRVLGWIKDNITGGTCAFIATPGQQPHMQMQGCSGLLQEALRLRDDSATLRKGLSGDVCGNSLRSVS